MTTIYFKDRSGKFNKLRQYQFSKYENWCNTDKSRKTYSFKNGTITFYKEGQTCFMDTTNHQRLPLYKYIPGSKGSYCEVDKNNFNNHIQNYNDCTIYFRNNSGIFNQLRSYQESRYREWSESEKERKTYYFNGGKVTFYKEGETCYMDTTNRKRFILYKYFPGTTGCYSEVDKDHYNENNQVF
tara:strand:+ start:74 stop:625 length:552 start_codon:yes stop_codon:yes gene_type:complete